IEAGLTIATTHCNQRNLAGEGHETFEDAWHAAQLSEGISHVVRLAQYFLTLAVATQSAGLQYRRQTDAGNGGVQVVLREDIGELGCGYAQLSEHGLLEPTITGDAQRLGAGEHRHELR